MRGLALFVLALPFMLSGCGDNDGSDTKTAPSAAKTVAETKAWSVVALGDSVALANPGCDGCTSFVDLWAQTLTKQAGRPVHVSNQAVGEAEATDVVDLVKDDDATRTALENADVIVIQIGINDTPWNQKADPCRAAPNYPVIQWRKITNRCIDRVAAEYERTLDTILAAVQKLRAGKPTALRLTNVYNAVLGNSVDPSWDSPAAVKPSRRANARFAQIQCRLARAHEGICIDVHRAFNGSDGSQPAKRLLAADHTHPSPKGHEVIADLLAKSGIEPLR